MKNINNKKIIHATIGLLLFGLLLLSGCDTLKPIQPQPSPTPPTKQLTDMQDVVVTYSYGDTNKVQLSANNIVLKVGQKLVLQPAPGLTKPTRFTSSGENFFGDIMKQETDPKETGKAVFTAIKPGKGKLQIIPNDTEIDRATDLWVTVQ
jgi:hypothetical protein